jgi:hypothetical protein
MAGHPRVHLPGLQVQRLADAPALRGRDGHTVGGHGPRQRLHCPARGTIGRVFGDQLHQEQHIVVVIDAGSAGALEVIETTDAVLAVTLTPQTNLVVVQVDELADVPVRMTLRGQQHNASPLGHACFHRAGASPRLEDRLVTPS